LIIQLHNGLTEEEKAEALKRQERYQTDPKVKELADKIHHHRMMPPPTCDGCIAMAIHRLDNGDKASPEQPVWQRHENRKV
jgi:hypothetical protein